MGKVSGVLACLCTVKATMQRLPLSDSLFDDSAL